MSLSRSSPLTSRRDCDWECTGVTGGGWKEWECSRGCGQGRITPPGEEPPPSRCKGLSRSKGPKRTSRPKPINPEKRKRSRTDPETGVRYTYGPFWKWASGQPCAVCGRVDDAPADHWKTVGAGGRDPANCVPACADHQDRHDLGPDTWAATYDVDPVEVTWTLWVRFCRERPELAEKLAAHLPERL